MTTVSYKNTNKTHNCSDEELKLLEDLYMRCQSLKIQQMQMLRNRNDLLILNEKNETTSESLLKVKNDYEFYKSHLHKTLFMLNVSIDKQTILSRQNLHEFSERKKAFEEYYKVSPVKHELEKLIKTNKSLEEEWKRNTYLFELTKKQHGELMNVIVKTFRNKVCEFCDEVLRLKAVSN